MNLSLLTRLPEKLRTCVKLRAQSLSVDSYSATHWFAEVYHIHSPQGERYTVDLRDETCTCVCWTQHYQTGVGSCCKHLLGLPDLLATQADAERCRQAKLTRAAHDVTKWRGELRRMRGRDTGLRNYARMMMESAEREYDALTVGTGRAA